MKKLAMDFHSLKRKNLQSLCKKNKIPANMTNKAMADALMSLKSVKRKANRYKADTKRNFRKKSMRTARKISKSTQEKESIAPFAESKNIKRSIGVLPDPFPMEKVVIFMILSFLPTEAVLRLKAVCRAWAEIISDPAFIHVHCFRPAPVTSFFAQRNWEPDHVFTPLQTSPKFPSMITVFLSSGFLVGSASHGLVCFHRDEVIIMANPATSHWTLIPRCPFPSLDENHYTTPLIVYDPTMSLHFKLTIATCKRFNFPYNKSRLRFHIYSSEASSWAVSSVSPHEGLVPYGLDILKESRIGGGSVCWQDSYNNSMGYYNNLMGYEIASDTYWMTPLPLSKNKKNARYSSKYLLLARDGEIYCAVFDCKSKTLIVRRLDEKKSWVLEGAGNIEELQKLEPSLLFPHASYDSARKALILAIHGRNEFVAFHLSSSRIEVLGQDNCNYGQIMLHHANTLVSFHGGKQDVHALDKLLHDVQTD